MLKKIISYFLVAVALIIGVAASYYMGVTHKKGYDPAVAHTVLRR